MSNLFIPISVYEYTIFFSHLHSPSFAFAPSYSLFILLSFSFFLSTFTWSRERKQWSIIVCRERGLGNVILHFPYTETSNASFSLPSGKIFLSSPRAEIIPMLTKLPVMKYLKRKIPVIFSTKLQVVSWIYWTYWLECLLHWLSLFREEELSLLGCFKSVTYQSLTYFVKRCTAELRYPPWLLGKSGVNQANNAIVLQSLCSSTAVSFYLSQYFQFPLISCQSSLISRLLCARSPTSLKASLSFLVFSVTSLSPLPLSHSSPCFALLLSKS